MKGLRCRLSLNPDDYRTADIETDKDVVGSLYLIVGQHAASLIKDKYVADQTAHRSHASFTILSFTINQANPAVLTELALSSILHISYPLL